VRGNYWWRAQNGCVDNTKLIRLSDKAHRNWFNLNCVANANGGVLPCLEDVALKLRITPARAAAAIAEMVSRNLFDKRDDGSFVPHDWKEWQFKTDAADPTNAERQKNFRQRKRDELNAMKALRDMNRNGALRNGVTNVTAKRPDTETDIKTTTIHVEGQKEARQEGSKGELASLIKQKGWAQ
jgi:hypothetical protein